MSATGRGTEREALDFYATPAWAVQAGLSMLEVGPGGGIVYDPAAGDGAILRCAASAGYLVRGMELDATRAQAAAEAVPGQVVQGDFFSLEDRAKLHRDWPGSAYLVAHVTNPPFTQAEAFVRKSMEAAPAACLYLLRMGFLATSTRRDFWRTYKATVGLLVTRPSFEGPNGLRREGGGTDACEYGWFLFSERLAGEEDAPIEIRRLEGFGPPKREPKPRGKRKRLEPEAAEVSP